MDRLTSAIVPTLEAFLARSQRPRGSQRRKIDIQLGVETTKKALPCLDLDVIE